LPKSPRDAAAIADKLTGLGFKTTEVNDATWDGFTDALFALRARVRKDDIVVFYFSGHGFQHDNYNFIVPIGARLNEPSLLQRENVSVDWIIAALSESRPAVIVLLLDACRQVQFVTRNGQSKGLAQQQGMQRLDVPPGTLVGYAASAGRIAWTGDDGAPNSIYTERLLASLDAEDVDILNMLSEVRRQVFHATGDDQLPEDISKLLGPLYLRPGPVARSREEAAWAGVGATADLLTAFIERFPGGSHVPEARARLALLAAALPVGPGPATTSPTTLTIEGPLRVSRVGKPGPMLTTVFGIGTLPIFQNRSVTSPVIARVAPSDGMVLLGLPRPGETGWAQVRTPEGSIGYVDGVTPTVQPSPATVSVDLPFAPGQLTPDQAQLRSRMGDALGPTLSRRHVEIRVPASASESQSLASQTAFIRAVGLRSALVQMGVADEQISLRVLDPQPGPALAEIVAKLEWSVP